MARTTATTQSAHVTDEQWANACKLDTVGQHLIQAYTALRDVQEREALSILDKTIAALRQVIPNAFPATYNED
jgi:hypothetical protein